MEKNLTWINDVKKENVTKKQLQQKNRIFILKPVPEEIDLPCALESGEQVCSDGHWVKVTHNGRQTFYRCGRRFELSVGKCFVGRQPPFFEKHRNINGIILLLVGSLSATLGAHFLWGSAGSASSFLTQPQEFFHNDVEPRILNNSKVLNMPHSVSALKKVPTPSDTPAAIHTPAGVNDRPSIAAEPELDPLRCTPLRSRSEQPAHSQPNINVQRNERTWYVCR